MLMKHYSLFFILSFVVFLLLSSCSKDSTAPRNDSTMAFVVGESRLYTDAGVTYEIVSSSDNLAMEFGTRVYVTCEVLDCLDETADRYSARLVNYSVPLTSAVVDTTGGKSPEFHAMDWNDAIAVNYAWLSGGYLNVYCSWIGHKGSSVEQETALVYCGESGGQVSFSLVHNSNGEGFYPSISGGGASDLVTINKMATFPVQEFLPSGDAVIKLSWIWHRSDGKYIYPETEPHEISYSFSDAAASAEPSTKAIISPFTTLLP